jgi:hypothetical protein
MSTHEIIEPDFEGEEMKLPENMGSIPASAAPGGKTGITGGAILIILVGLLLIILGGMYYWFMTLTVAPAPVTETLSRPTAAMNNEPESTTAEATADTMRVVSTSDEIDAIASDIEASDMERLDTELQAIEAEFEAATRTP